MCLILFTIKHARVDGRPAKSDNRPILSEYTVDLSLVSSEISRS